MLRMLGRSIMKLRDDLLLFVAKSLYDFKENRMTYGNADNGRK